MQLYLHFPFRFYALIFISVQGTIFVSFILFNAVLLNTGISFLAQWQFLSRHRVSYAMWAMDYPTPPPNWKGRGARPFGGYKVEM
jgi:hypothetical protein